MDPFGRIGMGKIWDLDLLQRFLPGIAFILVLWIGSVALAGWLAGRKGRDDGLWSVIAWFLGPVALLIVLVLPRRERPTFDALPAVPAGYSGEWLRPPAPLPSITTRERLLGSLLGAGLAAGGAALVAPDGVGPAALLMAIVAAAGAIIGNWLSGALVEADRSKILAIGLAAGVAIVSVSAFLIVAVRVVTVVATGGTAVEMLQLAVTGVLMLAGAVLYPIAMTLGAPGLLGLSLGGGVLWAAIVRFFLRRVRASGSVAEPTPIAV